MNSAIEGIINTFPHPTLARVHRIPDYRALRDTSLILNGNAASVPSNLGDGRNGHLFLTMTDVEYQRQTGVLPQIPINPGPPPAIPINATSAQVNILMNAYNENLRVWRTYCNLDKALKQQLVQSVEPGYIRALRNRVTGFASITTRQLLFHLKSTYGGITPQDLDENDRAIKTA